MLLFVLCIFKNCHHHHYYYYYYYYYYYEATQPSCSLTKLFK